MKILVISDTHGKLNRVEKVLKTITDIDRIIHLGDLEKDAKELELTKPYIIDYIPGNCDFYSNTSRDKIISFGEHKIWLTHGHQYNVKWEYETIMKMAIQKKANIILFGHTHIPYLKQESKLVLMNPGSLSQPRGGFRPSYGIIDFDSKDTPHFTINYL
ncbi:MAG: metallophosphoesterase [Eubacteriales bacterium]